MALMSALIMPLRELHARFLDLKVNVNTKMCVNGSVAGIEQALNELFFLKYRQIWIGQLPPASKGVFYFLEERNGAEYVRLAGESPSYILLQMDEESDAKNFIVYIPTFLCTSVENRSDDRYGWEHLTRILYTIEKYKPAGRRFGIKLYDYE